MPQNTFNTLDTFDLGNGKKGQYFSLRKLEQAGIGPISKLRSASASSSNPF